MAVGMNGRDVQNAVWALYGVIVRPGTTLCRISDNPGTYLVPSVGIFATAVTMALLFPSGYIGYLAIGVTWNGTPYSLIIGFVMGLLLILGIFGVGRWWGGNRSFRRAFPVLVYCMVPTMLGIVATTTVDGIYGLVVPEIALSDRLVMTSGYGASALLIQSVVVLFFVGWILLLQVKAIRILNGFGYTRSVAILVLSILIVYAGNLTQGIVTSNLL